MSNLNRLKAFLTGQNKMWKWLVGQLGKSNCIVSKWCGNGIQPDLQTLDKISKILEVDVCDLIVSTKK